jgi:hypothetical protein
METGNVAEASGDFGGELIRMVVVISLTIATSLTVSTY